MTNVSLVAARATDACTERRTGRRRDQRAPDGTTPLFLSSLFNRVRGRGILGSPYAPSCI